MRTYLQENNTHIANHLIVIMAFFLPISESARTSGIFILLMLLLFKTDLITRFKESIQNRVIQAFLLYWLMNFVWVLFSTDPELSLHYAKLLDYFYYPLLLMLYLDKAYIYRIFGAFILGMLLSELFSYSLAFGIIKHVPYGIVTQSIHDPSPFLYHMGYGFILTFTVGLLLQRIIQFKDIKHKVLYGLFFLTASANVFVNAGRTGYILYSVSIFALLILTYKKHFFKILPATLLFLALVYTLAYNFSPVFQHRMGLLVTNSSKAVKDDNLDSSVGARVAMGRMAIQTIKDRPLLGYGPGTAVNAVSAKARETDAPIGWLKHIIFPNIDNQYLEALVQFGFIGFFIFLNMFYQIFRYKQPDRKLKIIQLLVLFLALAYSVQVTTFQHGGYIPKFFVFIVTFTLVTRHQLSELPSLSYKYMGYYGISGILLFIVSKIT